MLDTTLEILRYKFPINVADYIYYKLIKLYRKETNLEILNNSYFKILNIKKEPLAYWLVNYESIQKKKYKYSSSNIIKYNFELNKILLSHHKFLLEWKKRNRLKYYN